jgi:hypothetical protein
MKQEYGYDNVYNMALKVHNIQPKGIYIGCEPDYINAIKEIFSLTKREYEIEIFFLVYSNVCLSQIIFEELMKNIDKNIGHNKKSILIIFLMQDFMLY